MADWDYGDAPWFSNRDSITSIQIGNSVTSIGKYAFSRCIGLTSVMIPGSVTSIGEWAFDGCTGLTSFTIPDGVTSIGDSAFLGCSGLTSVTISDSVTSIGDGPFSFCSGLTNISVDNGSTSYNSLDGVLFNYEITELIQYPAGKYGAYTIPTSVTSIGEKAFGGCRGLMNVRIPNSVTDIGERAFSACIGLKSVTIPDSVTSISDYAFVSCTGLTSVTIPDSITNISESAFDGCTGLTSVTIPDSVTSISNSAFYFCTGLTSVIIPASVTSIGRSAFSGCIGLTDVYYGGTEEQWQSINIGENNVPLLSTTIHYGELPEPGSVPTVFTDSNGNQITSIEQVSPGSQIIIKPARTPVIGDEEKYGSVFCAVYDETGVMVRLQGWDANADDGSPAAGTIDIPSGITIGKIKVFVLCDTLSPLVSPGMLV